MALPLHRDKTEHESALHTVPRVFISAGEVSGDEHGARLLGALREQLGEVEAFGMGGTALRAVGMKTIVDCEDHAVMGLTEVVGKLGQIAKNFRTLVAAFDQLKPQLLVIIDFPDFNLRLAKAAKRRGIPVLYFIPPQVWAWRRGRVRTIRKYVDRVLSIFPFEERFYRKHGVDAEFVGHPTAWEWRADKDRGQLRAQLGLDPSQPILALLPGSRTQEVSRLLPTMLQAFDRISISRPGIQGVIPVAPTIPREMLDRYILGKNITLIDGQARELMCAANAAIVASGTATVEALLARVPFVVVYRLSNITYRIARLIVRGVRYFAMPNLIAGEKIVEELLQDDATPERIAVEVERFLGDPGLAAAFSAKLGKIAERLQSPRSPVERVAEVAANIITNRRKA